MSDLPSNRILESQTVKEAMEQLNRLSNNKYMTLFVLNAQQQLVGTLTDGDIRRGLVQNKALTDPVSDFMHRDFKSVTRNEIMPDYVAELRAKGITQLPILNEEKRILRVVNLAEKRSLLPVDAVIMAGGRGERLRPLTDNTPKPLLKVGDKPIIEHNIDRLVSYGVHHITITIKYLGEQLVEYFGNGADRDAAISYTREDEPLGTIGSVRLVEALHHDTVLLMNSDLLTNIDFEDFYNTFVQSGAEMAVATIPYQVNIPYAVVEVDHEQILSFKEKPTYTYYSNAGIYLFRRALVDMIPKGEPYNATDLMEALLQQNRKVAYFPILGYWLDIGRHEDFQKANADIRHIQL